MLTIFGVVVSYEAAAAFALFVASEYIGLNKKLKSNSVAQIIVKAARLARPFRKEDDKLRQLGDVWRGK